MVIGYVKIRALEMKINLGLAENLEKGNLYGFANRAQKLIKIISIAISANRFTLILVIMLTLMVKNGYNVNIAKNGFIRIVKCKMGLRIW